MVSSFPSIWKRRGSEDILRDGVQILGTTQNPIEIALGKNGGRVEGRAINRSRQPEGNVPVVLVPAFDRYRRDLYRKVSADATGIFRFAGVAPGPYKVFAWEDVLDGAWQDPDFLRRFEGRGISIDIQEGRSATTELELIPWSETQ